MFIDLALAIRAPWLVTRDRDLLVLARQAHRHGLLIATPTEASALVEAHLDGLR